MFQNYLKIAIRNFLKYRIYSIINVFGLSIGLTCALLIGLYIRFELSYDRFHHESENIYRVNSVMFWGDEPSYGYTSSLFLAEQIREELTEEVESATVFNEIRSHIRPGGDGTDLFFDQKYYITDPDIYHIFSFEWIEGGPANSLSGPDKMVLTRSAAERYFPKQTAIGKTLTLIPSYGNEGVELSFQISGVVEDYPANSHLEFDFLVSIDCIDLLFGKDQGWTGWSNLSASTYVRLSDMAEESLVTEHINQITYRNLPADNKWYEPSLQPLTDIHLNTRDTPIGSKGNLQNLYIFGFIAILVLLIACINYMNLTTARSSIRSKEIGVRTVLGAKRKELFLQFMSEALIYTVAANMLAWVFVDIAAPIFNKTFNTNLDTELLLDPVNWMFLGIFTIVLGLLAGSYPAIYLSNLGPKLIKSGRNHTQGGSIVLRKTLVVAQFIASIVLIIGTLIIGQQMRYVQDMELGFNKEYVMYMPLHSTEQREAYKTWQTELERIPGVLASSSCNSELGNNMNGNGISIDTTQDDYMLSVLALDANFKEVAGLEIVDGHWFDKEKPTDLSSGFVINETAAKFFGWRDDEAIGKYLKRNGQEGSILGIAKDFHYESLHKPVEPLIMYVGSSGWEHNKLVLKLSSNNLTETIGKIEETWNTLETKRAFSYTFLDESLDQLYESDRKFGQILGVFAMLAIFIACLGLLGLVAFAAAVRSKEIGIRKVLGASIKDILVLIGKDFSKLLIISFIVAVPVSWYVMQEWLQSFAYKTSIGIEIFILAAVLTITIAMLTMGWHAYRAASLNPSEVLKDE